MERQLDIHPPLPNRALNTSSLSPFPSPSPSFCIPRPLPYLPIYTDRRYQVYTITLILPKEQLQKIDLPNTLTRKDSWAVTGYVLFQRPGFSKGIVKDFDEDPLQYCPSMIIADPDEKYQHDRSLMFLYLNDCFQNATKEQRARVDEPFAMMYSDWVTLHEIDKRG